MKTFKDVNMCPHVKSHKLVHTWHILCAWILYNWLHFFVLPCTVLYRVQWYNIFISCQRCLEVSVAVVILRDSSDPFHILLYTYPDGIHDFKDHYRHLIINRKHPFFFVIDTNVPSQSDRLLDYGSGKGRRMQWLSHCSDVSEWFQFSRKGKNIISKSHIKFSFIFNNASNVNLWLLCVIVKWSMTQKDVDSKALLASNNGATKIYLPLQHLLSKYYVNSGQSQGHEKKHISIQMV